MRISSFEVTSLSQQAARMGKIITEEKNIFLIKIDLL